MNVGLLGGSFNPLHVGHLRLAVETGEALGLDRVELLPAARPPHKDGEGMLPFALRAALCEAAAHGLPALFVNPCEVDRPGPSYTVDTLSALAEARPGDAFTFILGATDLLALPGWRRGLDIPLLAHLAVAGRGAHGLERVAAFVADTWPGARPLGPDAWELPGGRRLAWIGARRMDVSSSDVRRRWVAGSPVRGLVPECVEALLAERADEVRRAWSGVAGG